LRRRHVYAPHGLADVFNLVVRPNPVLAPRSVYETKAQTLARTARQRNVTDLAAWPVRPE
jgi:hypothetical protein